MWAFKRVLVLLGTLQFGVLNFAAKVEICDRVAAYISQSSGVFSKHGIELEGNLYKRGFLGKRRVSSSKPKILELGTALKKELEKSPFVKEVELDNFFTLLGLDSTWVCELRVTDRNSQTHRVDVRIEEHGMFEISSHIIETSESRQFFTAIVAAAKKLGLQAAERGGVHVHFDAQRLTLKEIHRIFSRYAKISMALEDVFNPRAQRNFGYQIVLDERVELLKALLQKKPELADLTFEKTSHLLGENKRSPLALRPSKGTIEARIFNSTFDMTEIANNELFMQRLLRELLDENSQLGKAIDAKTDVDFSNLTALIKDWDEFKSIVPKEQ